MYASAPLWEGFYQRLEAQARRLIDPATGRVESKYVETIPCPLCASTSFSPRVQRDGFQYVTCNECSFVYINPQLTQQAIKEVYNDEEVRLFFFEKLLLPYVENDQQVEFEGRARTLRSFISKPKPRLLDIGCALGNFLLIAEKHGFQGEGLELNQLYVDYVKKNRQVTIHQRLLEEMNYPDATFDAVTLWDVLEHLPRPLETLKEVARITAPGGIVALTTINHGCFNERILKGRWRYYMPPDHLCSFSPALLDSLLKKSGFTVVKLQHHYMFEVLAEHYFKFLTYNKPQSSNAILKKMKKLPYVSLALASQKVFNLLQSGDLLTVYARKF